MPVVLAYRMGKTQEPAASSAGPRLSGGPGEAAYEVTRSYEEAGVRFPKDYRAFDGTVRDGEVLIFPSGRRTKTTLAGVRNKRYFGMSGWALNGTQGALVGRASRSLPATTPTIRSCWLT